MVAVSVQRHPRNQYYYARGRAPSDLEVALPVVLLCLRDYCARVPEFQDRTEIVII